MTALFVIVTLLLILSLVANYFLFKLSRKLSDFAVRYETNIDEALDSLDSMYAQLVTTLEVPVHVDDPLTRRVLEQLRRTRDEILRIAGKISLQEIETKDERPDQE